MAKSFKRDNPVLKIIGRDYEEVREVPIGEINVGSPFVDLFSIKEEVYKAIFNSIKENGYDKAQPLIVWKESNLLIDGHTRLKAAREAKDAGTDKLDHIPIIEKSFASEENALDYVYKLQFARRNVKDSELILLAKKALEKYTKSYGEGGKPEYLAKRFIGLSVGKASKVITVLDNATEAQIAEIINETITLNALYEKLKRVRPNPFEGDKNSLIMPEEAENIVDGKEETVEGQTTNEDKLKRVHVNPFEGDKNSLIIPVEAENTTDDKEEVAESNAADSKPKPSKEISAPNVSLIGLTVYEVLDSNIKIPLLEFCSENAAQRLEIAVTEAIKAALIRQKIFKT
jgi:hypothetical protein